MGKCRKPTLDKNVYDAYIKLDVLNYKKSLHNKNTTILLAKDSSKNIAAALYARPLSETPVIRDYKTLYVDSIAVAPKYRGNNVGAQILEKLLNASKDRFTDVFLVSYRESQPFYEKLGFHPLNWRDPSQQFVISEMAKERLDYPQYSEFMTKSLNQTEPIPWYTRIVRRNIPKSR